MHPQAETQINTLVGFIGTDQFDPSHKCLAAFGLGGVVLLLHLAILGFLYSSTPTTKNIDLRGALHVAELVGKAMAQVNMVRGKMEGSASSAVVQKFIAAATVEEEQLRVYALEVSRNGLGLIEQPLAALTKDLAKGGALDMYKHIEGQTTDGKQLLQCASSAEAKAMNLSYTKLDE